MFDGAKSFNQPIGDWNISNVKSMSEMFCYAKSFNQPIGTWDISKLEYKYKYDMFVGAESYSYPSL
jgi:hypothetical protein